MKVVRWIEDHPNVHRGVAVLVILVLMSILMLVSGCASSEDEDTPSGGLDIGAQRACDVFARWWADGHPKAERDDVIREVHNQASNSNLEELDKKAERMFTVNTRTNSSANAFKLVADSFAYECTLQGWQPGG